MVVGAIAGSAPILQFTGLVDPASYTLIVTQDFTVRIDWDER